MLRTLFPMLDDGQGGRDPLDPWWYSDEPLTNTAAGVSVTEERALKYSAVWAATRFICETSARVPMFLYERTGERSKRLATDHPAYQLVHEAPNPLTTYAAYWEAATQQQVNGGNSYAEIERDRSGRPIAFWPIHHSRVRIERARIGGVERLTYIVRADDMSEYALPAEDVLHIPGALSIDGISGRSVVAYGRQSIGTGLATEEFAGRFFSNNARPGVVIKHPSELSPEAQQRLRTSWRELYGGASKANGVAVLDEGMDLKEIGFSSEAAQFIESRDFGLTEVARWYTLPPHKLADLRRATYSNIEQQALDSIDSIIPWNEKREQAMTAKVLLPSERGRYFIECDFNGLLRGDSDARSKLYRELFGIGVYNINTILAKENMNPIGPEGERRFINSTMIPLDMAGDNHTKPEPPNPAEPAPDAQSPKNNDSNDATASAMEAAAKAEAQRAVEAERARAAEQQLERLAEAQVRARVGSERVFSETLGRMVAIEANESRRAARKQSNFVAWVDEFYAEHAGRMVSALSPVADVLGHCGRKVNLAKAVQKHCDDGRNALLSWAECSAAELPEAIESLVENWNTTRTQWELEADKWLCSTS